MAEELQHLIDRIHREAIEKSEQESARILSQAKERAAVIVRDAAAEAKRRIEQADRDAQVYAERSTRTIEQAARDLLISVGQGVEDILEDIIADAVDQAMDTDTLKKMLVTLAEAYVKAGGGEQRIVMLIPEKDQQEIITFFAGQYRQKLIHGVDIRTDRNIVKGFKVRMLDHQVEHHFTREAIAESLAHFLRPHLAEIVHRAAQEASNPD
ncbi:MAG: ATPase [Kiritimatiellae bacterium]|nr:ATPase [Kiritimatiellia bacterium]